ncbi:MAG: hypothetical protein ACT4NV_18325 [Rhodoferax sp.]
MSTTPPPDTPPFDIKDYRQPMVTSLGVILGFILGFLGQWVTEDQFALRGRGDYLTFWGCVTCALVQLWVLWRMLSPLADPSQALSHYRTSLRLYVGSLALALAVLMASAFA